MIFPEQYCNIRCPHCDGLLQNDKTEPKGCFRLICECLLGDYNPWISYGVWRCPEGSLISESIQLDPFYIRVIYQELSTVGIGSTIHKSIPQWQRQNRYDLVMVTKQPIPIDFNNLSALKDLIMNLIVFS